MSAVVAADGPPAAGLHRRPTRRRATAAAGLALVLTAGGTYLVVDRGGGARASSGPSALTPYVEAAHGFSVSAPAGWARSAIPDGVLFSQASTQNAISVKKIRLARSVDGGGVGALRAVTDAVLGKREAGLTVLKSGAVTVGGLPGTYYVYRFPTEAGQGAHTHYFVFSGRDMYTLVFQALPASGFEALAPTFDAVAGSFRPSV
jgi:hypothetical protein